MPSTFTSTVWKPIYLSSSGRPILLPNERDIIIQDSIGLYQGDYQLLDYQLGRAYLTNKRIIYISESNFGKKQRSICLDLLQIESVDIYNGFFKSSPKVILHLKPEQLKPPEEGQSDQPIKNSNKIQSHEINWVCPICYFSNIIRSNEVSSLQEDWSLLPPCKACGIKATKEQIENIVHELENNDELSGGKRNHDIDLLTFDGSQCPKCTFINHPSMMDCEMCGTHLISPNLPPDLLKSSLNHSSQKVKDKRIEFLVENVSNYEELIDPSIIKLSFRNGGSDNFRTKLLTSIEQATWEKNQLENQVNKGAVKISKSDLPGGNLSSKDLTDGILKASNRREDRLSAPGIGIHGLQASNSMRSYETSLLLNNSLQDLENLMSKGKELIKLSQSYQKILMNSKQSTKQIDENVELLHNSKHSIKILDNILTKNEFSTSYSNASKLGGLLSLKMNSKSNSNNKSGLPNLYIEELSRQLYEFLMNENILDKNNGLITLYELYSMYNKARGINLISPLELLDSVSIFEKLGFNLKLIEIPLTSSPTTINYVTTTAAMKKTSSLSTDNIDKERIYIVCKKKISSTSISTKLINLLTIHKQEGLSILQIQSNEGFNMNYLIIQTMLNNLLKDGSIVIDQRLQGEFYYINEITTFNWDDYRQGKDNSVEETDYDEGDKNEDIGEQQQIANDDDDDDDFTANASPNVKKQRPSDDNTSFSARYDLGNAGSWNVSPSPVTISSMTEEEETSVSSSKSGGTKLYINRDRLHELGDLDFS